MIYMYSACVLGSREECENYDCTTTVESSDDEDEANERKRRKKSYNDFVTDTSAYEVTDKDQDIQPAKDGPQTDNTSLDTVFKNP